MSILDNKEQEFSFIGTNEQIAILHKNYNLSHIINITDVYLDTPEKLLKKKGFVYRQRYENDTKLIFTIKGKTTIGKDKVPEKVELEYKNWEKAYNKIQKLVESKIDGLVIQQMRKTERYVFPIKGYDLYIDYVTFVMPYDPSYVNVELELKNPLYRDQFIAFKDILINTFGLRLWPYGKTQTGEAIYKLGFVGQLDDVDMRRLEEVLEKNEK